MCDRHRRCRQQPRSLANSYYNKTLHERRRVKRAAAVRGPSLRPSVSRQVAGTAEVIVPKNKETDETTINGALVPNSEQH